MTSSNSAGAVDVQAYFLQDVRSDGGKRYGLELDQERLLHEFHKGRRDSDPALAWYLDIVCESAKIPKETERAREWLLSFASLINQGMNELVNRLEVGWDEYTEPFIHSVGPTPRGVKITLKGSALRSMRSTDIGRNILETRKEWEERLRRLPVAEAEYVE